MAAGDRKEWYTFSRKTIQRACALRKKKEVPMRYGLSLPTGGECANPQFLLELAVSAEEVGWEGIFLEDYICYTNDAYLVASPLTVDPWVALAALALQTKRVLLGTAVTPLPRRRPKSTRFVCR